MLNKNFKKSAAFTIIELAVSIVIIGILASIVVVSYPGIKKQMTITQMNADLRTAAVQLSRDFAKNGKYPDTKEESGSGKGLIGSSGSVLSYNYYPTSNIYCLDITNSSIVYHIDTISKNVLSGDCSPTFSYVNTLGGTNLDYGTSVAKTNDGGYVVGGYTYSHSDGLYGEVIITKYNSAGVMSWHKAWGSATGYVLIKGIVVAADGSIYAAGSIEGYGAGASDIILLKFDQSGNFVWNRTWGGAASDSSTSLAVLSDGSIVVTGQTMNFGAVSYDVFTVKYNSSGTLQWSKTWGTAVSDYANGISSTSDGGFAITGYTGSDMIILKYDTSGNLVFNKTFGGSGTDRGYGITELPNGNIIATGKTNSFGLTNNKPFTVAVDLSGNLLWSRTWSVIAGQLEYASAITAGPDNSVIIAGMTTSFDSSHDAFLSKYDISGNLVWSSVWGVANVAEELYSVTKIVDGSYMSIGNGGWNYGAGMQEVIIVGVGSDGVLANCGATDCHMPSVTTITPTLTIATPSATINSPVVTSGDPTLTPGNTSLTNNSVISTAAAFPGH